MTSSIINYIVEKYLANILEINTENTKSSLFSGTVEMGNLKIKPQIFEQLNLPYFELVNGYVGSFKMKMSLPRFYKYPIKITIDKVFFHAKQKNVNKLNENEEIQQMENYKESKLQSIEEITSQVTELSQEEPGMVQQIINNLQIEVGEVVFRFEDDISYPMNPFAFGAILKKILIKTTTNKYEDDNNSDNIPFGEINHKIIKVQGMSLFLDYGQIDLNNSIVAAEKEKIPKDLNKFLEKSLDFYSYCQSELNVHSQNPDAHHYLLFDLTTTLQIALNENIKSNLQPKVASNVIVDNLIFNLELQQLAVIFKLLAYFNLNNLYRAGISKKYYTKELSTPEKNNYMDRYIEYYKCKYVKKYLNQKEADKIKAELIQLQKGLTYDQVQSMRQASMIKIDYLFNMEGIDQKIAEIKNKSRIFSYFSRSNDEAQLQLLESEKDKLKGEEGKYDKMIQEQLALEKGIELDMYKGLPNDYVLMCLNLQVNKCVLSIGELDCRKLLDFVFVDFEVKVLLGVNFQNIFLYLNDFQINQHKFKNPFFNTIVECYEDEGRIKDVNVKSSRIGHSNDSSGEKFTNVSDVIESYAGRKGALYIEFENNPANELSNYRFKLRNERRLYITANIYVLQYTMNKMVEALKSNIDMKEISNYAKGEVSKYIKEGYVEKIFSGEYTHFNIEVDFLLKGPLFIIPQNIHDTSNTSCMIFSFGECQISSTLPPRMNALVDYTKITNLDKIYDVYTIVTQGFQLSTMTDFTNIPSIYTSKTKLDIVENVNIEIKIGNLIEPKNEFFENFRIGMKIHNIQIFFRDVQIEYMIFFLDGLMKINKLLKSELEDQADLGVGGEKLNKLNRSVLEKSVNQDEKALLGRSESRATSNIIADRDRNNNANLERVAKSFSTAVNRIKDKIFFSMEFVLSRIELKILKSLSPEEIKLHDKIDKKTNTPFKTYLNFVLNNFNFNLSLSERKNMKMNLKIFNMFFFDEDFTYKLENSGTALQQELHIHPEFQCLMGSINDEEDVINERISRSASMYSEAHEDPEIVMKNKGKKIQSFIEFLITYNAEKNKSVVKINFTKLLICLNLSSFHRLFLFGKHHADVYFEVMNAQKRRKSELKLSLKDELDQLKEVKNIKKANAGGGKGINQKFFKKVLSKMETRNKPQGMILEPNPHAVQVLEHRPSFITLRDENTYTKREKSRFKFSFEMKEIELNFPLDANSENTKVMKLNFNMMVKMAQSAEVDNFFTVVGDKLVRQNTVKKRMDMNMMIFNVDFDILNFRNGNFVKNALTSKILSNSRLTCTLRNFIILEKETNVTNVELHIEPISMIMGFRQVKVLSHYSQSFLKFMSDIKENLDNKNQNKLNLNYDDLNSYKSKLSQKIQEINDKIENQVKYNTANFNNLLDVNFKLDKVIIKMIDNTSVYDVPLTKIECSKISFKFISNSDPCDSDNMAQALVEMISQKEVTQFNIYNLYMYLDACYNVEILSYNEKVSDWEPIMEPWNAVVKISQVNKMTRLKIDFTSDVFLNLNLSFYSIQVFNKILRRLAEHESDWADEDKQLSQSQQIQLKPGVKDKNSKNAALNEISLEFINSTGVDLSFWFDADKTQIFQMKPNDKKYFTRMEMALINKKLTDSEISLMKKDKFTFSLLDCSLIEGIDFSYNHYSNLRISSNGKIEFPFIEVSVKIKNTGLIKTISIESNVCIHNNTQYKIGLHVVKTHDFISSFNGTENPNDSLQSNQVFNLDKAGVETIEPFSFAKVPLFWMTESHMMLGRIIDDKDEMKAYKLFYEELNFTYKFAEEFRNLNENTSENEKERTTARLTAKYSKIVQFDFENNRQINFALDMLLLRSTSGISIEGANAMLNSPASVNTNVTNTYYYILVINPPLVVENQIPYNLEFSYGRNSDDFDPMHHSSHLLPLQKIPIFYVNYLDNRNDLQLVLNYFKNLSFGSEFFSFLDDVHDEEKVIKLGKHKENFKENPKDILNSLDFDDSYEVTIKYENSESLNIFNPNYLKIERNFSKSKKMIFYVDFLIVNKLDLRLFIKSNNCTKSDDEINLLTNNTVYEHKVNLFNQIKGCEKAKIKSDLSVWSNALQINTHGVDGVVSLETCLKRNELKDAEEIRIVRNSEKSDRNTYVTDIGMLISSSSFFNYSTVIILEPRYMLVNQLGVDLRYRQMFELNTPSKEILDVTSSEMRVITFQKNPNKEESKKLNKYLQFILPNPKESDFYYSDESWSPTLNLDSLDEFNLKLPIPKSEYERIKAILPQQVFTYDEKTFYLLIRVTIHSNDNVLIYIIISPPKYPQFLIKNTTDEVLLLTQEGVKNGQNNNNLEGNPNFSTSNFAIKIPAYSELPFTWPDLLIEKKRIIVSVGSKEIKFSFDQIEKLKELKLFENQMKYLYFSTIMENKNMTRVLKVQMEDKEQDVKAVKQILVGKKISSRILKVKCSIKGVGISIIDENPREIFFISTYQLDVRYVNNVFKSNYSITNTENVELYVKNFQIDYCLEDSFKYIIFPKNQLLPGNEEEKEAGGDIIPFVQLLVSRKTIHNLQNDNKTTKISQIDFSMQELNVKIDQSVINTLLSLMNSFLSVVDFHKVGANKNKMMSLKEVKKEIVDTNLLVAIPGDYCPTLVTQLEPYEKIIARNDESNMIFIEALMLSGLKINLTLRIDISTLEISLVPGFIVKVLGTLGNALARITDSPLRFSELILQNCFTDVGRLVQMLQKHYVKQGVIQFYKIIGSSDLLGNPIGLVDRLGTGFIEFFNEPRKGFLQGPKQFGQGVAKGLNSLVSNVIGGGFDTVGKITGTLLAATKNLQGEKMNMREEDEPDNVVSGAYEGVKGGIGEIGKGIAGIFMNPYRNAKTDGVKGFFKGVGTGILGALISPFSAVLKVGNSLAVGLRNTATYFNRGKLKTERFRHPRHIIVNEPLKPYDENYAEVQAIIRTIGDLSDNKLIFFADFKYLDEDYSKETSTLIITDKRILVIYNAKNKVYDVDIRVIRNTEVHIVNSNFILVFFLIDGSRRFIMTENLALCCQVHGILQKLIKG